MKKISIALILFVFLDIFIYQFIYSEVTPSVEQKINFVGASIFALFFYSFFCGFLNMIYENSNEKK